MIDWLISLFIELGVRLNVLRETKNGSHFWTQVRTVGWLGCRGRRKEDTARLWRRGPAGRHARRSTQSSATAPRPAVQRQDRDRWRTVCKDHDFQGQSPTDSRTTWDASFIQMSVPSTIFKVITWNCAHKMTFSDFRGHCNLETLKGKVIHTEHDFQRPVWDSRTRRTHQRSYSLWMWNCAHKMTFSHFKGQKKYNDLEWPWMKDQS